MVPFSPDILDEHVAYSIESIFEWRIFIKTLETFEQL